MRMLLHHSQTFPLMSYTPNGLAGKLPTGEVYSHWSKPDLPLLPDQ